MDVTLRSWSVLAPGLPGRESAERVLAGEAPYQRDRIRDIVPLALPANERRRTPETARWALAVGLEALAGAGLAAGELATVFTSCGSDGMITNQICEALARPARALSPTQFHNSVHNAPGGYWSIALASRAPSTSVCAGEASFAAGLLEACAQVVAERRDVLLIAYDVPYPPPLSALWSVDEPFAVALVVSRGGPGTRMRVSTGSAGTRGGDWPTALPEAMRSNPAAACAPLLALLARAGPGTAGVGGLEGCTVQVEVMA